MKYLAAALFATAVLTSGCGGGGDDSASAMASPTATFPLQASQRAGGSGSSTATFTISGTCSGTARETRSALVAGSFEGVAALVATQTVTTTFTNCTPASAVDTTTSYVDSDRLPLGYSVSGGTYGKTIGTPVPLATSVKVGDTATIATQTVYSSSAKTVTLGSRALSYVVEPDTAADTAIVNFITRSFNPSGQLLGIQQARYRIAEDGRLTLLWIDIQSSTTHLVLTRT